MSYELHTAVLLESLQITLLIKRSPWCYQTRSCFPNVTEIPLLHPILSQLNSLSHNQASFVDTC